MTLDAYRDTFRFAARYWLLSPSLFGLMMVARIASNLVDIFVPLASGALVDTLASGGGDLTDRFARARSSHRSGGRLSCIAHDRRLGDHLCVVARDGGSGAGRLRPRSAFFLGLARQFLRRRHGAQDHARHVVVRPTQRYAAFWNFSRRCRRHRRDNAAGVALAVARRRRGDRNRGLSFDQREPLDLLDRARGTGAAAARTRRWARDWRIRSREIRS